MCVLIEGPWEKTSWGTNSTNKTLIQSIDWCYWENLTQSSGRACVCKHKDLCDYQWPWEMKRSVCWTVLAHNPYMISYILSASNQIIALPTQNDIICSAAREELVSAITKTGRIEQPPWEMRRSGIFLAHGIPYTISYGIWKQKIDIHCLLFVNKTSSTPPVQWGHACACNHKELQQYTRTMRDVEEWLLAGQCMNIRYSILSIEDVLVPAHTKNWRNIHGPCVMWRSGFSLARLGTVGIPYTISYGIW